MITQKFEQSKYRRRLFFISIVINTKSIGIARFVKLEFFVLHKPGDGFEAAERYSRFFIIVKK